MKIILCAYKLVGCEVLNFLAKESNEVYVYTHESPYFINDLKKSCIKRNINYSLEKISFDNLPFKPDLICVIYYNFLIPKKVIEYCGGKVFNLHPSILPKYRGCSSITWALINGEKQTGFTYHYIDETIDTGKIILQKKIPINDYDTGSSLYMKMMLKALDYFEEAFKLVQEGFEGKVQKGKGDYYSRGAPYNGIISSKWTIKKIERFIRAMNFPPYPFAKFKGVEVKSIEEYKAIMNE